MQFGPVVSMQQRGFFIIEGNTVNTLGDFPSEHYQKIQAITFQY